MDIDRLEYTSEPFLTCSAEEKFFKRLVLGVGSRKFDPLRLVAPSNRTGKVCFQGWRQVHALKLPVNLFEGRDAQVDEAYYVPS